MGESEKYNLGDIKKIYAIPSAFFDDKNLLQRIKDQFTSFLIRFKNENKEDIKDDLNCFYISCIQNIKDNKTRVEVHLLMFEVLNRYSDKYSCSRTLENVIKGIEKIEQEERIFESHPIRARFIYTDSLFALYNYKRVNNYSENKFNLLFKSKYYLFQVFKIILDGKYEITEKQISDCLVSLSASLGQLSRYFEPIYYLNIAKKTYSSNPNIDYLSALILDAIKNQTCLDYNGFLLLEIIDNCMSVSKNPKNNDEQKTQVKKIERNCRLQLKKLDLKIKELRKHRQENVREFSSFNSYQKYCINNQLFLNEHSFFCNCKYSTTDNLQVKTAHAHTRIDWTKPYLEIVDSLVFDFVIARHSFYNSLEKSSLKGFYTNTINRSHSRVKLKRALLKHSFKICYSILDQIAFGILKVFDVDYKSILRKNNPKGRLPNIYFLNMWDKKFFTDAHFDSNPYLISLKSIARDLSYGELSAFKEFRRIRNAMEHTIIKISNAEKMDDFSDQIVFEENDLTEKTKLLLVLTKSSIYSFNNLIRRQSKLVQIKK